MAKTKAEAEKWEKLHDQDTEHLASLQKRDNYGPTETLNETAMRLSRELAEAQKQRDTLKSELDEMTARAISLSMHLPPHALASDVQKWRDEALEEMNSLKRELAEARKAATHQQNGRTASAQGWALLFEAAIEQRDTLADAMTKYMDHHMRYGFVTAVENHKVEKALAAVKGGEA